MIYPEFEYGRLEHQQYQQQGFCLFDRFVDEQGLERCCSGVDRILAQLRPAHDPCGIIGAHQRGARWLWDLATQPALLDMIEHQIGPNIVLWCTHLVCKSSHYDRAIPWHQDAPYWNVSGGLAGGVWIPLDDTDQDNGTMIVLPRSHRWGTLPRVTKDIELFSEEIDPAVLPAELDRVLYRLPAGGLGIHDPMLVHGSRPNTSDGPRRVVTLRYMDAAGNMGRNTYRDWRTGEEFEREYFLVRGKDVRGRGLKRCPD